MNWFYAWTLAMMLALMGATWALAHEAPSGDWEYPYRCCNMRDCRPLAEDDVEMTADGYYIRSLDVTVPYSEANTSGDHHYHACTFTAYGSTEAPSGPIERLRRLNPPQTPEQNRSGVCFFAPEGGV